MVTVTHYSSLLVKVFLYQFYAVTNAVIPTMRGLSVSSPNVSEIDMKNFWDAKGYLTISRRTANGYALCDQFRHMIEELESVIATFTKSLGGWSESWKAKIGI